MKLAHTTVSPWSEVAAALESGRSLGDACARAGLERRLSARLTPAGAGAWVDLLDGTQGARVLVAEHSPGRAGLRLSSAAAVVGFADDDDARGLFRRRWLGNQPAEVVVDNEAGLLAERGPWDLIVVDGLARGGQLRRLAGGLTPAGRLVVVADNPWSPLRAADRASGRPAGPAGPSLRTIEKSLRGTGLAVVQRFGLLRSSADGVTAFDLDAPETASAILSAATVHNAQARTLALRMLRALAVRGVAGPIVPAWLVVASASPAPTPGHLRPTGRLGHEEAEESKVVRGEPPAVLEKRCASPEAAAREALALGVLDAAGLAIAPRLLDRPGPTQLRQTWQPGRPLRPADLRGGEVRAWVTRAAQTLGRIQRATERGDGSVLVHGDYWLGNLLVEGDKVAGVVDWTRAHWGDPAEDLHHLLEDLPSMALVPEAELPALTERARAAWARR